MASVDTAEARLALGGVDDPAPPPAIARLAWIVAFVAGIGVAAAGPEPTGTAWFDPVLLVVIVAVAAVVSARGPWWLRTGACGLGASLALDPLGVAFGVVGLLVGAVPPERIPNRGVVAVFVVGCACNSLARSQLEGFAGFSTVIGLTLAAAMILVGLRRCAPRTRRIARRVAIAGAAFGLVSAGLAVIAALGVRDAVASADASAQLGIDALDEGDYAGAADRLDAAASDFGRLHRGLGGALAFPSRLIPGLAQNVGAVRALAAAGGDMAAEAGRSLREVDPDRLGVSDGAVDLDAIRDVQAPMHRVRDSFVRFERTLADAQTPWTLPPLARRLDDLDEQVADQSLRLRNVVDAVDLLPAMLGDDSPRRYLVLFTSPAEARGLGGFPGSWTTVEVDRGRIDVGDVGRIDELNEATLLADCGECDEEMLLRYGRFGLTTRPGDLSGPDTWSNLTIPTNFPAIADAAHRLFPQATGTRIDGVVVMDPYAVQTLASYGGPVAIPRVDEPIPVDEIARFIIADQYLVSDRYEERVATLQELGTAALDGILRGDLPDPPTMLADLAPLVAERRLLVWTADADEQRLLDGTGLIGDLPELDDDDGGFSVAVTNAAANKIDRFLGRQVTVTEVRRDGRRWLRAEVSLTNGAPATGLPDYVIGNRIDLPPGHHRLLVSFYGPTVPSTMTVDGEPVAPGGLLEDEWVAVETFVDFSPGERHDFVLEYPLPAGSGEFEPTVWEQPLATRSDP